jgi:hypothetical protein
MGWENKTKEIVCLKPDSISLLVTTGPVTDELLNSNEASEVCNSFTRIDRERIRSIQVKRVGFIGASSLWSRFRVESERRVHEFHVPDRDLLHVTRALREIAGDRFQEQASRQLSGSEWRLIAIGIGWSALVALIGIGPMGLVAAGGVLVFGLVVLGLLLLASRWERSHSEYRMPPSPQVRRPRARVRRPFRSPLLGWVLKIVGLVYLLGVFLSFYTIKLDKNSLSGIVLVSVACVPGLIALAIGYRLCLRTFEPRQHPDPRPPVLFLRAFDDDGKRTFQPRTALAYFHGIFSWRELVKASSVFIIVHPIKLLKMFFNRETHSVEETLSAAFRRCGPLIAIGRPGEVLATSGADRMYVPDGDWQKVVSDYLEVSQAVVLQPANTDGVRWEIETVFARLPRHRLLLSMLNFKGRPNFYEGFRDWLLREHGIRLSLSLPFQDTPSFVYFEPDGTVRYQPVCYRTPLLWTFVGNAVDTDRTLRAFIQGLNGRQRDLPLKPKRHFAHAALSVLPVLGLFFGLLFYSGTLRYNVTVANAIAHDRLRTVFPIGESGTTQATTYRGRVIPYEFSLSPDWKPAEIPSGIPHAEHLFEFQGDLGKLLVKAFAGQQLSDLSSETLPSEVQKVAEKEVRTQVPTAMVKLQGSRWLSLNGVQWREVALEQHYAVGVSERKQVYFYSGSSGWIIVVVILPNYEYYKAVIDKLISTFWVPEAGVDRSTRPTVLPAPGTFFRSPRHALRRSGPSAIP